MYAPEAIIRIERATRYFGRRRALHEVSLTVQSGEMIVIIGPKEAGKSTLLRTINGLVAIDSGRIVVGGHDLGNKPSDLTRIRMEVGMVIQRLSLFPHKRVLENLTLAPIMLQGIPTAEAEAEGLRLLAKVGMRDKARSYPAELTPGQQQRAAIARALAMHPRIMLFDEPTAALEPEMSGEVLEVMIELAKEGMTMLIACHETGFARAAADRIVVMDRGEIIETGHPARLLEQPSHPRTRRFLADLARARSCPFAMCML